MSQATGVSSKSQLCLLNLLPKLTYPLSVLITGFTHSFIHLESQHTPLKYLKCAKHRLGPERYNKKTRQHSNRDTQTINTIISKILDGRCYGGKHCRKVDGALREMLNCNRNGLGRPLNRDLTKMVREPFNLGAWFSKQGEQAQVP